MKANERGLAVVILAAGQGKRMKSGLVKVLHELCGRPMLAYPVEVAEALAPERLVVVVGRDSERVCETFSGRVTFALQTERRGTGHAMMTARAALDGFAGDVLILYGDTPLLRVESIERMRAEKIARGVDLLILSAMEPLPGRIVRDAKGKVLRIVEMTDATPDELRIQEGNTGTYLVDAEFLWKALDQVDDMNAQGEIYLTDIVGIAVRDGRAIDAVPLGDADEALGINSRAELARASAVLRRRTAQRVMDEGVTLIDPDATYLDWDVQIGRDTVVEPGCVIQGPTRIGERCTIKAHTVIESSEVGDAVVLGPSAHLRPGSRLGEGVRIGNFVEVKNSNLGAGVKADHLSYIGDADVGAGASFGCGSVVVNYDGVEKHRTRVEERAFIGCNANLIAPVTIEQNAFVAAGSTVTESVPKDALAVARAKQRNVEGWRRKREQRSRAQRAEGERSSSDRPESEQRNPKE